MPKPVLAFSVPAMDWNIRSIGIFLFANWIPEVIWVSTQDWVGIWYSWIMWSNNFNNSERFCRLSVAGLIPITASPLPYISPSRIDAEIPIRSSVGWFGCKRVERCPSSPMVFLNRVTTRHFFATRIRSWLRMILLTAATISGISPIFKAVIFSVVASVLNSQLRKSPRVKCEIG